MKTSMTVQLVDPNDRDPQPPVLGDVLHELTAMHDAGAPNEARVFPVMGDKGDQRETWPYLRGIRVEWES